MSLDGGPRETAEFRNYGRAASNVSSSRMRKPCPVSTFLPRERLAPLVPRAQTQAAVPAARNHYSPLPLTRTNAAAGLLLVGNAVIVDGLSVASSRAWKRP